MSGGDPPGVLFEKRCCACGEPLLKSGTRYCSWTCRSLLAAFDELSTFHFSDLSQQAILPGSFGSVAELVDTINHYLSQHNLEPKRYVWHVQTAKKSSTKSTELGRTPQILLLTKSIYETVD
jgi:hypothetical protein